MSGKTEHYKEFALKALARRKNIFMSFLTNLNARMKGKLEGGFTAGKAIV